MSSPTLIEVAAARDINRLAYLIADTFQGLSPDRWLVPDLEQRVTIMPLFFRIFVAQAVQSGLVYTTSDRRGVAVWACHDGDPDEHPSDHDDLLAQIAGDNLPRFHQLDELMGQAHPHVAHDHLLFLAVAAGRQGHGIGSGLLRAHHARLDESGQGRPAYLEATTARSAQLYRRHGYKDTGQVIRLPNGEAMYPMLRHPQPPATASGEHTATARPPT